MPWRIGGLLSLHVQGRREEVSPWERAGADGRDHMLKRRRSMSKLCNPRPTAVFCGVDVSAATLAVAVQQEDRPVERREFANSASGHKALIAWLRRRKAAVRVSLEATGIYSLDLA